MTRERARCGPCGGGLRLGRTAAGLAAATRWGASRGARMLVLEPGAAIFLLDVACPRGAGGWARWRDLTLGWRGRGPGWCLACRCRPGSGVTRPGIWAAAADLAQARLRAKAPALDGNARLC